MVTYTGTYSLGWNFDRKLLDGVIYLNSLYSGPYKIKEVFGALPDSPISSARPTCKIPNISWYEFQYQVQELRKAGISFNFLMNTKRNIDIDLKRQLPTYLNRLSNIGITHLTLGTTELIKYVKSLDRNFYLILSITNGTKSLEQLREAVNSGADSVYLDGVSVNRDFNILRKLIKVSGIELRLYANLSCIANCPVVREHYDLFSGIQDTNVFNLNDAYFAGCSLIKAYSKVEWMQIPWIRPEDIKSYISEGIHHFKLSDRFAETSILLQIAESYLSGVSPDNLFTIIERDGAKYGHLKVDNKKVIFSVDSKKIPHNFIEHFRNGDCKSSNKSCSFCNKIASEAIDNSYKANELTITEHLKSIIPQQLLSRIS